MRHASASIILDYLINYKFGTSNQSVKTRLHSTVMTRTNQKRVFITKLQK